MSASNPFEPSFGNRPTQIVGRDKVIDDIVAGLSTRPGSRDRATVILGMRGMGKTALLLEIEARAEQAGFVVGRSIANETLEDVLLERIQIKGREYAKEDGRRVKGFSAGALGFSVGLTFSDEVQANYGFETKLGLLCDRLSENDKGVLLLVDEITASSPQMRSLASSYQNLVGDEKNIAICMAGLPSAMSSILNDEILTFLNRATKIDLPALDDIDVRNYFAQTLDSLERTVEENTLGAIVEAVQGFPYLLQLIGYYLVGLTREGSVISQDVLDRALERARRDMKSSVFRPTLAALSDKDIEVLTAIAKCGGTATTAGLTRTLGVNNSYFQAYRARLLEVGVIDSPRRGQLEITVPFLADHLRSMQG